MTTSERTVIRGFLYVLALSALLAILSHPARAQSASHSFTFTALTTAPTETADHDIAAFSPMPTGTVQLVVTGSPTSCTYQILGRLKDGTGYDVLAEITGTDCVNGKLVHFESKAVDVVRGKLSAISGGTTPSVVGLLKLVTR